MHVSVGFDGRPREGQKQCAVLGRPVAYSLSPVIHRAAYRWLGLDWTYGIHEVGAGELPAFVASCDRSWRGLSLTMPLKEVAATLGSPSPEVTLTGVANTLVFQDDSRFVFNTDIEGFQGSIKAASVGPIRQATVLGSGATALSAIVALARLGVSTVEIVARNRDKVEHLVRWADQLGISTPVGSWQGPLNPESELLVSTLPADSVAECLPALAVHRASQLRAVFDVSYHPWPSPLARAVIQQGCQVLSGLDLLVHQAVDQVKVMAGRTVPADVMMTAAQTELRRREES